MTEEEFIALNQIHPYLTYIEFNNESIIGIMQSIDTQIVTMYVYNILTESESKSNFLSLGQLWWENSNRLIPINIFLKEDFKLFRQILKCYPKKNIKEIKGPILNLEENFQKRIKRKRIQLVRNLDIK